MALELGRGHGTVDQQKGVAKEETETTEDRMKELMLGNKAVARGLYEAGCCVISSYPGTPSTEITEEAAKISGNLLRVGPQ